MVTASAAATTLRLNPEREAQSLARDHSLSNQLGDNRPEPW
jgi:hypothetical protein